jgi:chromosome segregation protein
MDKGAHFYRCDLQVHTPRDQNWKGKDATTPEERFSYAQSLVNSCREKGLNAIAVTDHHDMAFVPYVRKASEEETDENGNLLPTEKRLVVFPGIELTLGVPCQALIILDENFPDNMFMPLLTALTIVPVPDDQPRNGNVTRLDDIHSFVTLKEQLDKHPWLKDRYIIFPNVTGEGEFSLLRAGQMGKYIEMPCVGGFIDGSLDKLKPGPQNIVEGRSKEWGNKRIACFQTSDNRYEDHRDLGQVSTWIKWAAPTAEALRQACLAQESRISQDTPRFPSVVIASISVSNSVFLGPINLEFNHQYNALIGGRGTGKSTILEYLRWALCDQPPGIEDDELPNYQGRRGRLIDQTLKPVKATVQIQFEVNDVPHVVRRNSEDNSLLIKIANEEMLPCTEEEVRTLLPIQAYSQKQLSDVSVRVEELTRFITAPILTDLSRIERQASDRAERVRQTYGTVRRERALIKTLQKHKLEEKSLGEQAKKLRTSLTGLSEEDRALIDRGKIFDAADLSVQSWRDEIESIREGAKDLRQTVISYSTQEEPPPTEPEEEILKAAYEQYRVLLAEAAASLEELIGHAEKITSSTETMDAKSPWRQWAEKSAAFKTAYEAAVQRSSAHSEKMKQLKDVEEQIAKHARTAAQVKEELRKLADAGSSYREERDAWQALLNERDGLLNAQCESLTESSGNEIRARVQRYSDTTGFVSSLRQSLSGSRIQGSKTEAIGESIMAAADGTAQWNALLDDLEKLADFDVERPDTERRPETPILSAIGLTNTDLDRVARALKPEDWLTLSLTPIKSVPIFEYQAREAEYIPFRNASAGQQATALLKTLLNQAGPPLIIDQPEEDLDNQVMLEIVEQVWQAKQKRQLIFASHNANLVVNGDAELVAWCNYRAAGDQSRGMIAGEGAIDIPEVCEAIKKIMEGGAAAFNLRKEKYGF